MTPEQLVAEQKKLEVSVWSRAVSTQEHFNQMILQVRNHLLTLVTAIVGAAALIHQKDISITVFGYNFSAAALLCGAGLFIILAFYVTEKGYHNLLIGAVEHAEELETRLDPMVSGIRLGHSISAASKKPILFMKLESAPRIRFFYGILCALFGVAFFVFITAKASPSIANDPQAGTKALKLFQQSGAYTYVLDEVVSLAEAYVDANVNAWDKSNAVAVFDIDETALSTWEILSTGAFTWDASRFNNFVLAGRGKQMESTHHLYEKLKALGIPIVFLTSRSESLREATAKNLHAEGFDGYEELIMKPMGSSVSTKEFKQAHRNRIRGSGKKIVLAIGDQLADIEPEQKTGQFLLPNPFY
jgi:predicted secreted acid phosphatase